MSAEIILTPSETCDFHVYKDWGGRIVVSILDKERAQPYGSTYAHDYKFLRNYTKNSYKEALDIIRELILEGYKVLPGNLATLIGKVNKIPDNILNPPKEGELEW